LFCAWWGGGPGFGAKRHKFSKTKALAPHAIIVGCKFKQGRASQRSLAESQLIGEAEVFMRQALLLVVLTFSSLATAQSCTSYVVINAWEPRLHIDIQTLKGDDFLAKMGDSELPVVSFSQGYNSRLLVLLEVDGAEKNEKIGDVVDTVTRMVRQAPEGKPVAFGVYADHAVFTKGFVADPDKRSAEIGAIIEESESLGKRVSLFDSLHESLKLFGQHQPGDTVLLVASPYDDKSSHSSGDVEREFLTTGTRLMIMLREPLSDVSRDFTHTFERRMFVDLPERTGGAYSEWDPHFFGFSWRGYMLGVRMPDNVRKPKKWQLKLQPSAARSFSHSKLFYPELVPPCQATAVEKAKQ